MFMHEKSRQLIIVMKYYKITKWPSIAATSDAHFMTVNSWRSGKQVGSKLMLANVKNAKHNVDYKGNFTEISVPQVCCRNSDCQ